MAKRTQKQLNTAVRITYKDGTIVEYPTLEEASAQSGLSESAIKIRCNKSRQGGSNKKDKITCMWIDDTTFRSYQAKQSKAKGNNYELKIIKELIDLGFQGLKSSRSENRNLDNKKIDIVDTENCMDCYIQCKATSNVPNISKINQEVGLTDRPLAIFWNKQNNSTILEEFVIIPKDYFYKLITNE